MRRLYVDGANAARLMLLIAILVAMPLLILPFYPGEADYASAFLFPSAASALLSLCFCRIGKVPADSRTARQRASLTVVFAWAWAAVVGAMPFIIAHLLSPMQALFEAVSGWTTTGLSTMDVATTPRIYLFHRSFMQYCGGLGFVMMMIVLISGRQSMDLYTAEGHPDKLMPNLSKTARIILVMYVWYLLLGTIAYALVGMSVFEAVCHTMCALSTGGFSTRLGSIGEYNSVAIELITIVLMLIGTSNFALLLLISKRKWRQAAKVSELRFTALLLVVFVPLMALLLRFQGGFSSAQAWRSAAFDTVSALSTSGYSSMAYNNWPQAAIGLLIILMLVGGGIGSTAGGIKLTRVYLLLRMAGINIKTRLSSSRRVERPYYVRAQGKAVIDEAVCADTVGFVVSYLLVFLTGALLTCVTAGCGLTEGAFEFASALGTVGLSIGVTGPQTGDATLLVEIVGMLLGRLEIFIALSALHSGFHLLRRRLGFER